MGENPCFHMLILTLGVNVMSLIRKHSLLGRYLGISHTFVDLSAFLVKRETQTGQQLFIEEIAPGGIIHSSGIKHSDRVISLNLNTDVDQMPFDLLVEAISSLRPLVLELERTVIGEVISIVAILDIGLEGGKTPYLKFSGFYWNVRYQDIENFIPINVIQLVTYNYNGKDENVYLSVTENNAKYYLAVENSVINFTRSSGTRTNFTVYKYTPSVFRSPGITLAAILAPKDQPNRCLAATANNDLLVEYFNVRVYTGVNIPAGPRFLEFSRQPNNLYYIRSTVRRDSRITKVQRRAVMRSDGSLFTWE